MNDNFKEAVKNVLGLSCDDNKAVSKIASLVISAYWGHGYQFCDWCEETDRGQGCDYLDNDEFCPSSKNLAKGYLSYQLSISEDDAETLYQLASQINEENSRQ